METQPVNMTSRSRIRQKGAFVRAPFPTFLEIVLFTVDIPSFDGFHFAQPGRDEHPHRGGEIGVVKCG
jgi:hypothetical protein